MEQQNYNNHIRWYPWHHFVFYPLLGVLGFITLLFFIRDDANRMIWAMFAALIIVITFLSLMLRQHYALMNQNRIVRLELRFRYYTLTHQRFEEIEAKLSTGQIFALRFAPDNELIGLVERAVKENLPAGEIKRAIKNWLPDEMRV